MSKFTYQIIIIKKLNMFYKIIQFTINKRKIWATSPLDFAGQVHLRRLNLY